MNVIESIDSLALSSWISQMMTAMMIRTMMIKMKMMMTAAMMRKRTMIKMKMIMTSMMIRTRTMIKMKMTAKPSSNDSKSSSSDDQSNDGATEHLISWSEYFCLCFCFYVLLFVYLLFSLFTLPAF